MFCSLQAGYWGVSRGVPRTENPPKFRPKPEKPAKFRPKNENRRLFSDKTANSCEFSAKPEMTSYIVYDEIEVRKIGVLAKFLRCHRVHIKGFRRIYKPFIYFPGLYFLLLDVMKVHNTKMSCVSPSLIIRGFTIHWTL